MPISQFVEENPNLNPNIFHTKCIHIPGRGFLAQGHFIAVSHHLITKKSPRRAAYMARRKPQVGQQNRPPSWRTVPCLAWRQQRLDLINVWLGPYPASNSPPDCCDWICSSPVAYFPPKRKTHPDGWVSFCLWATK